MTRRERMEHIVKSFIPGNESSVRGAIADLIRRHGLSVFTDEAIEELTSNLVIDWKWTQENNRKNRAIWASQHAAE